MSRKVKKTETNQKLFTVCVMSWKILSLLPIFSFTTGLVSQLAGSLPWPFVPSVAAGSSSSTGPRTAATRASSNALWSGSSGHLSSAESDFLRPLFSSVLCSCLVHAIAGPCPLQVAQGIMDRSRLLLLRQGVL